MPQILSRSSSPKQCFLPWSIHRPDIANPRARKAHVEEDSDTVMRLYYLEVTSGAPLTASKGLEKS